MTERFLQRFFSAPNQWIATALGSIGPIALLLAALTGPLWATLGMLAGIPVRENAVRFSDRYRHGPSRRPAWMPLWLYASIKTVAKLSIWVVPAVAIGIGLYLWALWTSYWPIKSILSIILFSAIGGFAFFMIPTADERQEQRQ